MQTPLLISGLPGKMAEETVRIFQESDDYEFLPHCLASDQRNGKFVDVDDTTFECRGPSTRDTIIMREGSFGIEYSTPDTALDNIRWFAEKGIPFVCGTTGFDITEARRIVESSEISAVIAPNMAVPIVMIQAAMAYLENRFSGALQDYDIKIRESHQINKKDTSGTARIMLQHFQNLGLDFRIGDLKKVRDATSQQKDLAIPKEHLSGHAYHTYNINGAKDTVDVLLEHNVRGRRIYAEGTQMALRFLQEKIKEGSKGQVYSLIDVLENS